MKALSLTQPWAALIAIGAKRIETRSWSTAYRGEIAIHASKAFPIDCQELCYEQPFAEVLGRSRYGRPHDLPRGGIVALARLVDVVGTLDVLDDVMELDYPHELAFGDYSPGRYGFLLDDVRPLAFSIPCKGALGIWTVPDGIAATVLEELTA